jgi:hypothetical protein
MNWLLQMQDDWLKNLSVMKAGDAYTLAGQLETGLHAGFGLGLTAGVQAGLWVLSAQAGISGTAQVGGKAPITSAFAMTFYPATGKKLSPKIELEKTVYSGLVDAKVKVSAEKGKAPAMGFEVGGKYAAAEISAALDLAKPIAFTVKVAAGTAVANCRRRSVRAQKRRVARDAPIVAGEQDPSLKDRVLLEIGAHGGGSTVAAAYG